MTGFGLDGGDYYMDVGDPAVADEDLLPIDHPVRAIPPRARLYRADVAAAARLGHGERGELDVAGRAEAFGRPLHELLIGGRLTNGGQCQRGHHDRQPDPRAAPEELLHQYRQREPGRIGRKLRIELPLVQALSCRLLDDGPRELLSLVIFGGSGPYDLARERCGLLAQSLLVIG